MIKDSTKMIKVIKNSIETEYPIFIRTEDTDKRFSITASLKLDGEEYVGMGMSLDADEAFADLQKKLPEGVLIKCCVSCQYGNFCPYGSIPEEIYCIFPQRIGDKLDLVDLLAEDKYTPRDIVHSCDNFLYSNEENYSYNSFDHYLKKQ
jgi:hypothetical protein